MNEVFSFLTAWLADLLVMGTAILALSCLAVTVLRLPATRMAVARGTLLGLAMLCVLTALPGWPRQPLAEVFSRAAEDEREEVSALTEAETMVPSPIIINALPETDNNALSANAPAPSLSLAKIITLLPLVWLGAAGLGLAYILIGRWRAFRLLRSAAKAPAWSHQELERLVAKEKRRLPRLKTSERIATAVALLAWRPHILLAAKSVTEDNKAAVRAALAHEWAHIRHGDLWLLALERLLLPIFCLHPLFWLLRRQIRIDQELLADAAAAGDAPVEYAEALMSWAKVESAAGARGLGIAALSLWEHPSSLSRRVEMLLHPKSSATAGGSRLWKWLAPLSLMAAVVGLSLVTLRPAAVAQDEAIADLEIEIHSQPEKVKKPKKTKPRKPEREAAARPSHELSPLPATPSEAQIQMQLLIGQVNHAAIENAESSLGDLIQAAAEDQCRLEGNLIVAELDGDKVNTLTGELKKLGGFEILSRPQIITLDRQEARVQVGSEVPLTRIEETVNGEPTNRIEYQQLGQLVRIVPRLSGKDSSQLTLEIEAVNTELDKSGAAKSGDATPRLITQKIKLEVAGTIGKTLLIAERDPKRGSGRTTSILLTVTPLKVIPVPPPAVTRASPRPEPRTESPEDLSRLRDENASLRKQIEEMRARMIDLEVHVRWLRDAAAPGAKVSDAEFLRRVYLDLTGLVPTAQESQSFLNDKDLGKRDRLIDSVLARKKAAKDEESYWQKRKAQVAADPEANPTTIKPSPDYPADDVKADDSLQIFRLTRSSADNVAQVLAKIFTKAEGMAVAVEERTNSLLIRGSPETLEKVKALLEVLDREVDPKEDAKDPAKAPSKEKGALLRLKEADLQAAQATLQAAKANYERFHLLRKEDAASNAELEQARHQLLRAEIRAEAVKGMETVKLRELELQEAEAALRSAEKTLESAKRLKAKGFLSELQMQGNRFAVEKQKNDLVNARQNLQKVKDSQPKPKE